jgi:hypothetical protein
MPGDMSRAIAWRRVDAVGVEYAEVDLAPLRLEGRVVLIDAGAPTLIDYLVECDDDGATRSSAVRLRQKGSTSAVEVERRRDGSWRVAGRAAPELAGIVDIDLAFTPSTNVLPLRRLDLAIGQEAEVTAAWVQFPSLQVAPLHQIYRRVSDNTYVYLAPSHGFSARLTVDEHRLPLVYEGLWERVG